MTRDKLSSYRDLQKEIKRLQARLDKLEDVNHGIVADTVKGSSPGFPYTEHSIFIEGFDSGHRNKSINRLKCILSAQVNKSMSQTVDIAEFICSIEPAKVRAIFEYRYYDLLSFQQIAFKIGVTDEAYPRRLHDNYLKQVRISPN